jgi:hypothetical protein
LTETTSKETPMSDPIPGQTRRQSRVEAAHAARTADDHTIAANLIAAVRGLDSPRADFCRVAEIVCEFITPDYTEEQERYLDRLTDHLASVVCAMNIVLEDRKAARMDTLPTMIPAGQKPWPAFPSDPEGNGWDDIDTTCEGGAR